MKQRFKPGQQVTMNKKYKWYTTLTKKRTTKNMPVFGKIYTVLLYEWGYVTPEWYIELKEIPGHSWNESGFSPIITDKELYTELETIKETITN